MNIITDIKKGVPSTKEMKVKDIKDNETYLAPPVVGGSKIVGASVLRKEGNKVILNSIRVTSTNQIEMLYHKRKPFEMVLEIPDKDLELISDLSLKELAMILAGAHKVTNLTEQDIKSVHDSLKAVKYPKSMYMCSHDTVSTLEGDTIKKCAVSVGSVAFGYDVKRIDGGYSIRTNPMTKTAIRGLKDAVLLDSEIDELCDKAFASGDLLDIYYAVKYDKSLLRMMDLLFICKSKFLESSKTTKK